MSLVPPPALSAPGPADAVIFSRVEKSFFGVKVLTGVSFEVRAGRVLGLVGENGAGKSTLMNLLGGNLQPDAGELQVDGHPYAPRHPTDARAAGIAFVHQELNLFPNLSIAENLFLDRFPRVGRDRSAAEQSVAAPGPAGELEVRPAAQQTVTRQVRPSPLGLPWINRRALRLRAAELLLRVGLEHSPDLAVERLSAGECQLVEIARALGAEARVLILDEPTTSLSARECERLFALIRQLRERGLAVIYISHALGDVLRLCDDLVVLRDGGVVGRGPARDFTGDRLVSLMVGRQLNQLYPERRPLSPDDAGAVGIGPERKPVLEVTALSQPGVVRGVSLTLAAGEVLGIGGLMGAGRSELARILFGLDPHSAGEIRIQGRRLQGGPRRRIQRGLAFLTEDRRKEGLCLEASIADNLALVTLARHARPPGQWLNMAGIKAAIARMRGAVGISAYVRDDQPVRTLSGGNQQKVVLGKWLLAEPKVLLLDEPTRGIDVGARFEIYQLILQLAERGAGVMVISSEIEELIGLCDRILVMRQGALSAEFRRPEFDRESILAAALPSAQT